MFPKIHKPITPKEVPMETRRKLAFAALLISIIATGFAGMVAEYSVATLTSYLNGNTIASWAVTISLMMFSMAIGGYLTQRIKVEKKLLQIFITLEIILSFVCSSVVVFIYNMDIIGFGQIAIFISCVGIGALIGAEIPILNRIVDRLGVKLSVNVSLVLAGDYVGSLIGGLTFAYFFVPKVGMAYTPVVLGTVNLSLAFLMFISIHPYFNEVKYGKIKAGFAAGTAWLILFAIFAPTILMFATQAQYDDMIVFQKQTRYQNLVITSDYIGPGFDHRMKSDDRLFINGQLQVSTSDEYRYHESLVHPSITMASKSMGMYPKDFRVLVLGGGDGMAIRETLKHPFVKEVVLIDIDQEMIKVFQGECSEKDQKLCDYLARMNNYSFHDPRVRVVIQDAFIYLRENRGDEDKWFDTIIIDLPDPNTIELNKLYTREFYRLVKANLSPWGTVVTQSSSPFHSRHAFLMVHRTLTDAGFSVAPMWINVPSFGEWGFNLGVHKERMTQKSLVSKLDNLEINVPTRWLNSEALQASLRFGKDIFQGYASVAVNTLIDPLLAHVYEDGWDIE